MVRVHPSVTSAGAVLGFTPSLHFFKLGGAVHCQHHILNYNWQKMFGSHRLFDSSKRVYITEDHILINR